MKILHTTDLHFNKLWFQWIADQQDNFDVFCISGDFLESSKNESLSEQIEWVSRWIKEFNKPLFVCSGNHDIEEPDNEEWLNKIDTPLFYPDNFTKTINGVKFGCYPYIGADGYYELDDCDILITHVPPADTNTSTDENGNDWGDKELFRAITGGMFKANIVLCGHMHKPVSSSQQINNTMIYNPGVDHSMKIPNHNIIEV